MEETQNNKQVDGHYKGLECFMALIFTLLDEDNRVDAKTISCSELAERMEKTSNYSISSSSAKKWLGLWKHGEYRGKKKHIAMTTSDIWINSIWSKGEEPFFRGTIYKAINDFEHNIASKAEFDLFKSETHIKFKKSLERCYKEDSAADDEKYLRENYRSYFGSLFEAVLGYLRIESEDSRQNEPIKYPLEVETAQDNSRSDKITHFEKYQIKTTNLRNLQPFCGRSNELAELKEKLDLHHLVYIRGEHGSGKTSLALNYAQIHFTNEGQYNVVLFCTYDGSIHNMIMDDAQINVGTFDPKRTVEQKLAILKSVCDDKTLLIIDNLDCLPLEGDEKVLFDKLIDIGADILITTCSNAFDIGNIDNIYELQELSDVDALNLFKSIYTVNLRELLHVKKLINYLDNNAFLVELVAKQIKADDEDPEAYFKKLETSSLADVSNTRVLGGKRNEKKTPFEHLTAVYSMTILTDVQKDVLQLLALFPRKGVRKKFLFGLIPNADTECIEQLINRGYIRSIENMLTVHDNMRLIFKGNGNSRLSVIHDIVKRLINNLDWFSCRELFGIPSGYLSLEDFSQLSKNISNYGASQDTISCLQVLNFILNPYDDYEIDFILPLADYLLKNNIIENRTSTLCLNISSIILLAGKDYHLAKSYIDNAILTVQSNIYDSIDWIPEVAFGKLFYYTGENKYDELLELLTIFKEKKAHEHLCTALLFQAERKFTQLYAITPEQERYIYSPSLVNSLESYVTECMDYALSVNDQMFCAYILEELSPYLDMISEHEQYDGSPEYSKSHQAMMMAYHIYKSNEWLHGSFLAKFYDYYNFVIFELNDFKEIIDATLQIDDYDTEDVLRIIDGLSHLHNQIAMYFVWADIQSEVLEQMLAKLELLITMKEDFAARFARFTQFSQIVIEPYEKNIQNAMINLEIIYIILCCGYSIHLDNALTYAEDLIASQHDSLTTNRALLYRYCICSLSKTSKSSALQDETLIYLEKDCFHGIYSNYINAMKVNHNRLPAIKEAVLKELAELSCPVNSIEWDFDFDFTADE